MESLFTKNHTFALIKPPYEKSAYLKSFNCINTEYKLDDDSTWPDCFGIECADDIPINNWKIKSILLSEESMAFPKYIAELKSEIYDNLSKIIDTRLSQYIYDYISCKNISSNIKDTLPNYSDYCNWFVIISPNLLTSKSLGYLTNNFKYFTFIDNMSFNVIPKNNILLLDRRQVYVKCWRKVRIIRKAFTANGPYISNSSIYSIFNVFIDLKHENKNLPGYRTGSIRLCEIE